MIRTFVCVCLVWAGAAFCDAEFLSLGQCLSIKQLVEHGVHLRKALARDILDDKAHLEDLRHLAASWVTHIYCLDQNAPSWQDLQTSRLDYCLLQVTFRRTIRTLLARMERLEAEIAHKKQLYFKLKRELEISRATME